MDLLPPYEPFYPSRSRELYNQDFLDSNCNAELASFHEQNGVDSSIATFSTNYIIAAIAILFALVLNRRQQQQADKEHAGKFVSLYFCSTGLSFLIAGVGHQFSEKQEEVLNQYLLRIVAFFASVGTFALLRTLLLYRHVLQGKLLWTWWIISGIATVWGTAVALANPLVVGVPGLVAILSGFVLHIMQWKRSGTIGLAMKTFSFFFYLVGGIFQAIWAPVCGYDAYPDCFVDCPLPAPEFNHNALFHVFVVLYFLIYGAGEWLQPAQQCLSLLRREELSSTERQDGDIDPEFQHSIEQK